MRNGSAMRTQTVRRSARNADRESGGAGGGSPNKRQTDIKVYTGKRRKSRVGGGVARQSRQAKEQEAAAGLRSKVKGLLDMARYELHVDPYRGMVPFFSVTYGSDCDGGDDGELDRNELVQMTSPWERCRGALDDIWSCRRTDASGCEEADGSVPRMTCCCPSVAAWTEEERLKSEKEASKKAKGRKRKPHSDKDTDKEEDVGVVDLADAKSADSTGKSSLSVAVEPQRSPIRLGARKQDPDFHCPCDYNPFCLASLGGVVDEHLRRIANTEGDEQCDVKDVLVVNERVKPMQGDKGKGAPLRLDSKTLEEVGIGRSSSRSTIDSFSDVDSIPNMDEENEGEEDQIRKYNQSQIKNVSMPVIPLPELQVQSIWGGGEKGCKKNWDKNEEAQLRSSFRQDANSAMDMGKSAQEEDDLTSEIRKSIGVEAKPIRSYLKNFVFTPAAECKANTECCIEAEKFEDSNPSSVEDCMVLLQKWHASLSFSNPRSSLDNNPIAKTFPEEDRVMLSIPPGMRNLGATCYLNSQFQCLAQNLAFTHGVFSWKELQEPGKRDQGAPNSRMSRVLSTMQLLLARMIHGPDNVVCTDEFSSALGLENNEMQDPNEFARLLFDRMHESFQQSSVHLDSETKIQNGKKCKGLHDLLPRIYGGVCTYVTRCLHCSRLSERSEHFMDLTLPIAPPIGKMEKDLPVRYGRNGRRPPLPSSQDSDVQLCLGTYLHPEVLDGENQYFCDECSEKCDATRTVTFGTLPPVLNVQLARYVFDRKTFTKRKLTDRVLLPRILYVPKKSNNQKRSGRACKKKKVNAATAGGDIETTQDEAEYVLCAVLNHLGSSAYGGHYVAEAMDWTTGVWYEYNDEDVTVLAGGPSCSYEPMDPSARDNLNSARASGVKSPNDNKNIGARKRQRAEKIRGSADAYNIFYVEKSYLGQHANFQLQRNASLVRSTAEPDKSTEVKSPAKDVIERVTRERMNRYSLATEVQLQHLKTEGRLADRKAGILESMIGGQLKTFRGEECVWVRGDVLRRFLSCSDDMDNIFRCPPGAPLLKHEELLCSHGGLHPRMARKGKLLGRECYDAYVSLLVAEHKKFQEEQGVSVHQVCDALASQINDCVITTEKNMICQECAREYQNELSQKVKVMNLLMDLHKDLDPLVDDVDNGKAMAGNLNEEEEEQHLYAISRSFITVFRKYATQKMKEAAADNEKMTPSTKKSAVLLEGLDSLDLDDVTLISRVDESTSMIEDRMNGSVSEAGTNIGQGAGEGSADGVLDKKVNSKITCEHGSCNVMNNRRLVRYVSTQVWEKIVVLFPHAIPHRKIPFLHHGSTSKEEDMGTHCAQCHLEKNRNVQFVESVELWATEIISTNNFIPSNMKDETMAASCLEDLHRRGANRDGRVYPKSLEAILDAEGLVGHLDQDALTYHLVHCDEVESWRKAINMAQTLKKRKKKSSCAEIQQQMRSMLFESCDADGPSSSVMGHSAPRDQATEDENTSSDLHPNRRWKLRPLICKKHGKTVESIACIKQMLGCSDRDSGTSNDALESRTVSMSDLDRQQRIEMLSHSEYHGYVQSMRALERILFPDLDLSKEKSKVVLDANINRRIWTSSSTPFCHPLVKISESQNSCTSNSAAFPLERLGDVFNLVLHPAPCDDSVCRRDYMSYVVTSNDESTRRHKSRGEQIEQEGSGADVESSPNTLAVRVHLIGSDADIETVSAQIFSDEQLSKDLISSASSFGGEAPRRSIRKRKTRSEGDIPCQDISMQLDGNIANLRLLLMQEWNKSPLDQKLVLIEQITDAAKGSASEGDALQSKSVHLDLPFEYNTKSMREVIQELHAFVPQEGNQAADQLPSLVHVLIYYAEDFADNFSDPSGVPGKKKKGMNKQMKDERKFLEESIICSLTNAACSAESPSGAQSPIVFDVSNMKSKRSRKGSKRRREERGFRGTFLQSISSVGDDSDAETGAETTNEFNQQSSVDQAVHLVQEEKPTIVEKEKEGEEIDLMTPEPAGRQGHRKSMVKVQRQKVVLSSLRVGVTEESSSISSDSGNKSRTPSPKSPLISVNSVVKREKGSGNNIFSRADPKMWSSPRKCDDGTPRGERGKNKNIARSPASKDDLSREALTFTRPAYKDVGGDEVRLPGFASDFLSLTRENFLEFIKSTKKTCFEADESPSYAQLFEHLPEGSRVEAHARHLYRNFIDSPDAIRGQRDGWPMKVNISRRELDIILYFCWVGGTHEDCHQLMPYREQDGLRTIFDKVLKMNLHTDTDEYMSNVRKCVGLIIELELRGEDQSLNATFNSANQLGGTLISSRGDNKKNSQSTPVDKDGKATSPVGESNDEILSLAGQLMEKACELDLISRKPSRLECEGIARRALENCSKESRGQNIRRGRTRSLPGASLPIDEGLSLLINKFQQ